jgi:hypothetical protein
LLVVLEDQGSGVDRDGTAHGRREEVAAWLGPTPSVAVNDRGQRTTQELPRRKELEEIPQPLLDGVEFQLGDRRQF